MDRPGQVIETYGSDGALRGQVCERQGVRGVRGKLRGSRAELRWRRMHVRALDQRSQPVTRVSQATMAWKRSGVRVP